MEDEIENIDIDQDNLHDEVACHNEVEEEIRLRKPTPGSKIADLTNIIEAQLHSRAARSIIWLCPRSPFAKTAPRSVKVINNLSTGRPAGGVDPLQAAQDAAEEVGTIISALRLYL